MSSITLLTTKRPLQQTVPIRIWLPPGNMRGDRHPVRLSAHVDDTVFHRIRVQRNNFRGVLGGDRVTAQLHGRGEFVTAGPHGVGTITKRFTCSTRESFLLPAATAAFTSATTSGVRGDGDQVGPIQPELIAFTDARSGSSTTSAAI